MIGRISYIVAVMLVGATLASTADPTPVRLGPGHYTVRRDGAAADLRLLPVEHSLTFQIVASRGEPSLDQEAALLRVLLPAVLSGAHPPVLSFLPRGDDALVGQLAQAVARDKGWDGRRGAPRAGAKTLDAYLLRVLDASGAAKPYADAFAAQGYRLDGSTITGVLTGTRPGLAGQIPVSVNEIAFEAHADTSRGTGRKTP